MIYRRRREGDREAISTEEPILTLAGWQASWEGRDEGLMDSKIDSGYLSVNRK